MSNQLTTKNLLNAGMVKGMTESFSNANAGVFCLAWNFKNALNSIQAFNIFQVLKLFFSLHTESAIYYYPSASPDGIAIEIFRRTK